MKPELIKQHFEKGDYISPKEIEKILEKRPESFDVWRLASYLDVIHEPLGIVVRIVEGGIKFCVDNEATEYCDQRVGKGMNDASRYTKKQAMVDVSKLTPSEKERHERNHHRNTLMVLGAQEGMKRAAIEFKPSSQSIEK
jgi:hypothetical protein